MISSKRLLFLVNKLREKEIKKKKQKKLKTVFHLKNIIIIIILFYCNTKTNIYEDFFLLCFYSIF